MGRGPVLPDAPCALLPLWEKIEMRGCPRQLRTIAPLQREKRRVPPVTLSLALSLQGREDTKPLHPMTCYRPAGTYTCTACLTMSRNRLQGVASQVSVVA